MPKTRRSVLAISIFSLWIFASTVQAAGEVATSANDVQPLGAGATIPRVTLTGLDGDPVDLSAEAAKQPTILVFYRGGW